VRIGMEIGNPEVEYDEISKGYDYYGDTVNIASRVNSIAFGGQTLVTINVYGELSPAVREQCSIVDVGEVTLKGVEAKKQVYQVLPAKLARVFRVPEDGSSTATSSLASPRAVTPRRIESMTKFQMAQELQVLREGMKMDDEAGVEALPEVRTHDQDGAPPQSPLAIPSPPGSPSSFERVASWKAASRAAADMNRDDTMGAEAHPLVPPEGRPHDEKGGVRVSDV